MFDNVRSTIAVEMGIRDSGGTPLGHSACGLAVGPWLGASTRTVDGSLHAALTPDGVPMLVFFGPDAQPLAFPASSVARAAVAGRGLVKAIQVTVVDDDGHVMTLSFRGPIKRITGMFAACGLPVQ
jgi:hypothetical protein